MANANQTKQTARDMTEQATDAVMDTYEQYKPQIERYQNDIMASVRDKPIQSLAIAAGIASALGALLRK
jgi:ElaB/YqjD/DUF883 family membrane-anchored ribosome-binding protein